MHKHEAFIQLSDWFQYYHLDKIKFGGRNIGETYRLQCCFKLIIAQNKNMNHYLCRLPAVLKHFGVMPQYLKISWETSTICYKLPLWITYQINNMLALIIFLYLDWFDKKKKLLLHNCSFLRLDRQTCAMLLFHLLRTIASFWL